MTIWKLALARRSSALLPRMGSSKRLSHSSTDRVLVIAGLERRCLLSGEPAAIRVVKYGQTSLHLPVEGEMLRVIL